MSEPNAHPEITAQSGPIPLTASQLEYAGPETKSGRAYVARRNRLTMAFFTGSAFLAAAFMASEHLFQPRRPRDWAFADLRQIVFSAILFSLASAVPFGVITLMGEKCRIWGAGGRGSQYMM